MLSRIALSLSIFVAVATAQADLSVKTVSGAVIGHLVNNGTVREFLGIPYAKAPVGSLRFAPPQSTEPWKTPINASALGPTCWNAVANVDLSGGQPAPAVVPLPPSQDEDCLSVNIWTPRVNAIPLRDASVMIWIYGGGFTEGGSYTDWYQGGNFVQEQKDVIMVTFNYRLNVFGYPAAPGLPSHQENPGLLDIRAAVEWVQKNIQDFGGDPEKITLFGQSAGSAAVDAYLYFAADDPIIRGAIQESGVISIITGGAVPASAVTPWAALGAAVGCATNSTSAMNGTSAAAANLACMRAVPAETLVNATVNSNLTFVPTIDNGTVFSDTQQRLATGRFARVPVLIGSNDAEIPGVSPGQEMTLVDFTCPAASNAAAHTKFGPTWQYRWFGDFPTGLPGAESPGAFHGSEVTQVFGTYNRTTATPAQIASSQYMQGAWAAFARNPTSGLLTYYGGWPRLNLQTASLIELALNNSNRAHFAYPSKYDAACNITAS